MSARKTVGAYSAAQGDVMNTPDGFEMVGRRAFYRPVAVVSFTEAVALVADAITYAREVGASELLVNTTRFTGKYGFEPPNTTERYLVAEKWALATGGRLRVAVVARQEMIDRRKFGVTVAANRGAVGDIFRTEAEALTWLDRGGDTKQN